MCFVVVDRSLGTLDFSYIARLKFLIMAGGMVECGISKAGSCGAGEGP